LELDDGAGKVHDILASLGESIESHEKSVGGNLPLVLRFSLILEVGILEFRANIKSKGEFIMGLLGFISLDKGEDGLTIDIVSASVDNGITDFSNQNNKS
jgi:hypothetical protein